MKKAVFVLLLIIAGQWVSAQEGAYEVKGSVSDSSGEAIIGDTTEQLRLNLSPRRRLVLTISYAFSAGDQVKPVRTESAATLSVEKPVL